jgi:hypothetical protein
MTAGRTPPSGPARGSGPSPAGSGAAGCRWCRQPLSDGAWHRDCWEAQRRWLQSRYASRVALLGLPGLLEPYLRPTPH